MENKAQRCRRLILMFQEKKEVEKDSGARRECHHMALMCSFPQDGNNTPNTEAGKMEMRRRGWHKL